MGALIRNKTEPINAVKAAIKLDRLELAFTIFKQRVMKDLILERTAKNIQFVAKAFLREHYKDNKDLDIHEVSDSITLELIEKLSQKGVY